MGQKNGAGSSRRNNIKLLHCTDAVTKTRGRAKEHAEQCERDESPSSIRMSGGRLEPHFQNLSWRLVDFTSSGHALQQPASAWPDCTRIANTHVGARTHMPTESYNK